MRYRSPSAGKVSHVSEFDRQLIALLKQNSRRTYSQLSGMLGASRTTVKDHIDRLQELGIIKRFTVDIAEAGHRSANGVNAFFHVLLRRPVCKIIYESVSGWPELVGCWSIAGGTDMTLLVMCASDDELEILRDRLARHPEVETLWTAMVLRQWKHAADPMSDYQPNSEPDRLDNRLAEIAAERPELYLNDGLVQAR